MNSTEIELRCLARTSVQLNLSRSYLNCSSEVRFNLSTGEAILESDAMHESNRDSLDILV
jgi:hypothetical protein